ncbi:MAG: tetratricopeptide repeat protein [Candidatus Aminicenantes bacterium]|nr:tetratricopeptide repeat protein [Candidatus Aminicenantes bacterium]
MNRSRFISGIALVAALLTVSACMSSAKKLALERERDPQYQFDKAALCLQYNMVDESFKYIDQALALNPRFTAALNLRGLALMMKGRLPEAIQALQSCVEINAAFSEGWNNLATAYDQNGQREPAVEAWKKAYGLDQNYNAAYNLAKIDYENDRNDSALDWIKKAISKFPKSVLAFNLQGLIYDAMERYYDAIGSFQQAIKLSPTELNVQYNLATIYYKRKDYAKARELLEKILPQAKDDLRIRAEELLKSLPRL